MKAVFQTMQPLRLLVVTLLCLSMTYSEPSSTIPKIVKKSINSKIETPNKIKALDDGTGSKTSSSKSVRKVFDIDVEKTDSPVIEHPLQRLGTKSDTAKKTGLDFSIAKILQAEREKAMLIKRDHIGTEMDTDNIEEERLKEDGEIKKLKMFLYQRRKFDMNDKKQIDLHFGFDMSNKVTKEVLPFHPDLSFNKVLLNLNNSNCLEENQCIRSEKDKTNEGIYNSHPYSFYNAVSFLGVQRIRPGELSKDNENDLDHFFTLPMEFYNSNDKMDQNILGLAPNSVIWNYWDNIYNFPSKRINLTLCYYEDHEYILFDSKIDFDKEIILKVPKKNNIYQFKGELDFEGQDSSTSLKNQEVNLCIGNEDFLTMKVTESIMDLIKTSLCTNPDQCSDVEDLKDNKMVFSLMFFDYKKEKSFFHAKFFKNSFVEVRDNSLVWKIELINEKEESQDCQIILEQEFLKEKYLMISYDLVDPDSLYIGFKIMEDSDFSKFDFYFGSILLFLILTITMMILFIILNYKINRFIEKEEKEKDKLLQEA